MSKLWTKNHVGDFKMKFKMKISSSKSTVAYLALNGTLRKDITFMLILSNRMNPYHLPLKRTLSLQHSQSQHSVEGQLDRDNCVINDACFLSLSDLTFI